MMAKKWYVAKTRQEQPHLLQQANHAGMHNPAMDPTPPPAQQPPAAAQHACGAGTDRSGAIDLTDETELPVAPATAPAKELAAAKVASLPVLAPAATADYHAMAAQQKMLHRRQQEELAKPLYHKQQQQQHQHQYQHQYRHQHQYLHQRQRQQVQFPCYQQEQPGSVTFSMISAKHFAATVRQPVPAVVKSYFKLTEGAVFDAVKKRWTFPISQHDKLAVALCKHVQDFSWIPKDVVAAAQLIEEEEGKRKRKCKERQREKKADGCSAKEGEGEGADAEDGSEKSEQKEEQQEDDDLEGKVPPRLLKVLAPFQREGVSFILGKKGRGLIADEMGLGKTIQAIACCACYVEEWPLLIIAPSSARFHWQSELLKWLDGDFLREEEILVMCSGRDKIRKKHRVVITSYDLVNRTKDQLAAKKFGVVTADESHYLKNHAAARTKAIKPLAESASRVIFLSGTPALSRPMEFYSQLEMLQPGGWKTRKEFGMRYCGGKKGSSGWDYSGSSNRAELHTMLRAHCMIRRLKKDVLKGIPPKLRAMVEVTVQDGQVLEGMRADLYHLSRQQARLGSIAAAASTGNAGWKSAYAAVAGKAAEAKAAGMEKQGQVLLVGDGAQDGLSKQELQRERRCLLMKLFADTGMAKIPAVKNHVKQVVADGMSGKMLVFAHHLNVLNALEKEVLLEMGISYIRVDGRTKAKDRQVLVEKFQKNPAITVALLGLTAAGVGITLTAASRVVFAELFWTPAQLLQAEDRCHRIGQTSQVQVEYLVAKDSLDDCLWPLIKEKIKTLGEVVEGKEQQAMTIESVTAEEWQRRGEAKAKALEMVKKDDEAAGPAATWAELTATVVEDAKELALADTKMELKAEGASAVELDEWGTQVDTEPEVEDEDWEAEDERDADAGKVFDVADSDDEEVDRARAATARAEIMSASYTGYAAQAGAHGQIVPGASLGYLPRPGEGLGMNGMACDRGRPYSAAADAGAGVPTAASTPPPPPAAAAAAAVKPAAAPCVVDLISDDDE
ncbi:unnamed protein product [Chrysoparadoxa australica]